MFSSRVDVEDWRCRLMLRDVNGTQVQYVLILLVDVEDKC